MASSHLLCNTFHFHPSCNLSSKSNVSSFKPSGPFSFCQQLQSPKNLVIKATGKQVELVYDPDGRINKLADEVDKQAPLSRLTLFSPCKVNVFLRITCKRKDGYHDLASLFHASLSKLKQSLPLAFFLELWTPVIDRLSTDVSGVLLTEDYLIIKALNHYRKKTGTDNFFWVHLDKKVPAGAGLGGGSSNAATALWAANQFSGCLATEKELQEWSSEIGSDIPFCFSHGTACCTGRGEIVQDIPSLVPLDKKMVLIKPPQECSTAEVYKRILSISQCFQLDKTSQADPLTLLEKISRNGISQDVCINDLGMLLDCYWNLHIESTFSIVKCIRCYILCGSTIVGIGSPDPPQFIYDEDEYQDVFVSEANFINREADQWYQQL
ncbi:hypothetical protein SADUNF_Sadunf09G0014400 [Salix dunnii]|uniref:GHMP kinase N-terminal domain-containing protein n=1 Tax=Salix dunnii TaxID=1413687 RepID=A0A835JW65_9ROSI|nr:hypothetical protein SADUNF_Sadunf09G0014400 [Salix dunnii]